MENGEQMIPFLEEKKDFEESLCIIIPVSFDGGSSWLKGANQGPKAILEASIALEDFDPGTGLVLSERGIHTTPLVKKQNVQEMLNEVQQQTDRSLTHKKIPCIIGGNHTVSLGAIQAVIDCYPRASILHIDAHTDLRDEYENDKFSHACVMKRARAMCSNILSVGIRSTSKEEELLIDRSKLFYAKDLMENPNKEIRKIVKQLKDEVYITIDLDAFDPSVMPSVSTPEPGGLSWDFVTTLLRVVSMKRFVVGFDVVELCPIPYLKTSDFTAAKLIYQTFSEIIQGRKKSR